MSLRKTANLATPHAVYEAGGWTWRVLKVNQTAAKTKRGPYASWFCAVQSPHTHGGWDYGDTYRADVERYGLLTAATDEFRAFLGGAS